MGSWISFMVANVGDWLASKKTKQSIAACVPLVVAGAPGQMDWPSVAWGCAGALGLGGVGHALADVGKEAAKLKAKAP